MIARKTSWVALGAALLLALPSALPAQASDADPAPLVVAKRSKKKKKIRVRKIRPKSGTTFIALDATVRIRFSRPVDPESINNSTIRLRILGGDTLDWTASLSKKNKLVTITPTSFFSPGTDYQVDVQFGVYGLKGEELKREKTSIFFTDATVPPLQFLRPDQFEKLGTTMFEGRAEHTATELDSGVVLLAGGMVDGGSVSDTADFFDPGDDEFRAVPSRLTHGRAFHPAVTLGSGAMLVGGWDGTSASDTTEVYDPFVLEFRPGPKLVEARDFVDAIELEDGRVLVVGGLDYVGNSALFSTTAEIYDPSSGSFRITKNLPRDRRAGHRLSLLPDGRVLITGGQATGTGGTATAEIFDPRTETFTRTSSPPIGFRQLHTVTTLSDGRVLIADGGNGRLELYDPEAERFFEAGGASFVRRTHATASLLPGDKVLLLGGFDNRGDSTLILESMDLYIPELGGGLGRVVRPDLVLDEPRAGHTATTLPSGRVLLAGGYSPTGGTNLATALIFNP